MKYKYILVLYHNWNQSAGWSRWAARLTSTVTGKQWCGMIPHKSNLLAILPSGFMDETYYMVLENMKLRDFRDQTAGFESEGTTRSIKERIEAALGITLDN